MRLLDGLIEGFIIVIPIDIVNQAAFHHIPLGNLKLKVFFHLFPLINLLFTFLLTRKEVNVSDSSFWIKNTEELKFWSSFLRNILLKTGKWTTLKINSYCGQFLLNYESLLKSIIFKFGPYHMGHMRNHAVLHLITPGDSKCINSKMSNDEYLTKIQKF